MNDGFEDSLFLNLRYPLRPASADHVECGAVERTEIEVRCPPAWRLRNGGATVKPLPNEFLSPNICSEVRTEGLHVQQRFIHVENNDPGHFLK